MSQSNEITVTKTDLTDADLTTLPSPTKGYPGKVVATTTPENVKDAGRVHIGGGMMRF